MNKILPIILVVVLSGYIKNVQAESIQAMQDIKPLMTTSEVIEIMGASDSFKVAKKEGKNYILNQWTNRLCNDWWNRVPAYGEDKCTFYIVFEDDKVIEKGVSNITKGESPNISFMYLFK